MYPHAFYGDICKFRTVALDAQYPMFCWNGVIYDTMTGKITEFRMERLHHEKV